MALQTGLAGLLSAFAFAVRGAPGAPSQPDKFILGIAVAAGIVLAIAWWLLLTSYRRLKTAKYAVITKIETAYFQIRPFKDEWTVLRQDKSIPKGLRQHFAALRQRYAIAS